MHSSLKHIQLLMAKKANMALALFQQQQPPIAQQNISVLAQK